MKKFYTLLLLLLATTPLVAQSIEGRVYDTDRNPIGYATVVVHQLPDTTFVGGTITDMEGRYHFDTAGATQLLLQVSSIGYTTQYLPARVDKPQSITLAESLLAIDEVVVKGTRPHPKITTEGVETTVENSILSQMGSGNEVLEQIPMVSGSKGEFEVWGRGAATIYIDNREVVDPMELDNLNATEIKSVEVISNPGARYDATVNAVILIKTIHKRGDGFGFNARSSYYRWESSDYINQLNTNYRKGGLDLFAKVYHTDLTSLQLGDITQTVTVDTVWHQQNTIDARSHTASLNGTVGVNYEIDKHHYLGARYELKSSPRVGVTNSFLGSDVYANSALYDRWENHETAYEDKAPTHQLNLYYSGKVDKLAIEFNADYHHDYTDTRSVNIERSEAFGERELVSEGRVGNDLYAADLTLTYPIWQGNFSLGSEYVHIVRSDEYINEDMPYFSSCTGMRENNTALFAEYAIESEVGNFVAGIRYEDAAYSYLVDGIEAVDKSSHYQQWFPSASYSTQIDQVGLQLSYSSRVIRPTYFELSNNLIYGNRMTLQTGNPYLKPTIRQETALTGMWRYIQAQVSYKHYEDAIIMWCDRYEPDPKVTVIHHRNIDKLPSITAFVAASPSFGWWKPKLSVGIQKQWLDLAPYGIDQKMNQPICFVKFNNTFDLPNDWIINLDGNYTSRGDGTAVHLYKDSYIVGCGVTKSLFKEALQVKLAVSDLLNQRVNAYLINQPHIVFKNLYHFDSREVSLTLRYNFNAAQSKYKGSTAGAEAMERL